MVSAQARERDEHRFAPRPRKSVSAASSSAAQFTPRVPQDGDGGLVLLWDAASLLGACS